MSSWDSKSLHSVFIYILCRIRNIFRTDLIMIFWCRSDQQRVSGKQELQRSTVYFLCSLFSDSELTQGFRRMWKVCGGDSFLAPHCCPPWKCLLFCCPAVYPPGETNKPWRCQTQIGTCKPQLSHSVYHAWFPSEPVKTHQEHTHKGTCAIVCSSVVIRTT